jgi:TatD DNase family protein
MTGCASPGSPDAVGNLTDTHCHLNLNSLPEDRQADLARAWERGVERILVPGVDLETSRLAIAIAESDPRLYAAAGLHPSYAAAWTGATLAALAELARHPKVVAIGEIGLDYYRDHAPRELQREVFQAQLALAAAVGKPVSIHIRAAWEDVWAALSAWHTGLVESGSPLAARPGVLHSFSGTLAEAQAALARGFYLGISGPVTFTNARQLQALVAAVPLSALLIETDAPYLTPQPFRGKRNEPAHTHFIVEKVAALHHLTYDHTAAATAGNAARLFAWRA